MMLSAQLLLAFTACNSNEKTRGEVDEAPKATAKVEIDDALRATVEAEGDEAPKATAAEEAPKLDEIARRFKEAPSPEETQRENQTDEQYFWKYMQTSLDECLHHKEFQRHIHSPILQYDSHPSKSS